MKEENEINDSVSNISKKISNDIKDIKEPIYEMTIESEKGRKEIINIYTNSKPEEIAYNFCKENNLDFETLELMINQIKKLMKSITNKKEDEKDNNNLENEKKVVYCNEPILEDSEEQKSLSTEKIMKTKSFKEAILKNKEIEKNLIINSINSNISNNSNIKNNEKNSINEINKKRIDIKSMKYFKINGDFKEKNRNHKTSSIITNTINNCLELIEKEEKFFLSSNSNLSSKLGSSYIQNQKYSINSKENINTFNLDKENEKKVNDNEIININEEKTNNNINSNSYTINNNNRIINISKSFINRIPKCINNIKTNLNNNNININSRNNNFINNNENSSNFNEKNKKINIIELDSKNKTVSDEHKYSIKNKNKIKSLKNVNILNNIKLNAPNSTNSYEYYSNKQKEIIKKNKNKNFQRIINMIRKNNVDINQLSSESLTKTNNSSKTKKFQTNKNNNNLQKINNNIKDKIKTNNIIYYGKYNKKNDLKINNINSNFAQNSKDNYIYFDTNTNDKDILYSLSKNDENSTLNNLIKNSINSYSHCFSNLNSIKHEINMTILSKPQKKLNIPTPKNKNNIIIKNKNNKTKYRNCQTLSNIENNNNKKHFLKDFKSKILLTKNNNLSKNKKQSSINTVNKDKNKYSPKYEYNKNNGNSKINNIKKKYNFSSNISLYSPRLIKDFFNISNLKKYRNNFNSPQNKSNTTQTTMKYFIIKKNKTNMYKDSFTNNNKFLLTQSSRNNNINDYSNIIKQRCNSFNDFNSNINNIFINLKYSNNKKSPALLGLEKFNLENNSGIFNQQNQQNKKKINKKRNKSHIFSTNKVYSNTNSNTNSLGNKKSINKTIDKAIINNMNLNLNLTTENNNNSYSFKNKKTKKHSCTNLKNNLNNKCCSKSNLNKKRPCYLFIKNQNSSPLSTSSRNKKTKKNNSTLLQNSNLTLNLLKKNKIACALKEIFYFLSNKNNKIDIFKINKNNFIIPDDIIKSVQCIIQNCEKNKNIINIKDFILKGTLLFDSFPFEEQISILNFTNDK